MVEKMDRQDDTYASAARIPGLGYTLGKNAEAVDLRHGCASDSALGSPRVRGPTNGGERRRLLIVDDEELILRSLSRALRREYEVVTTTSPIEALRLASSGEHWDIVLSDVTMPGMSGIELAGLLSRSCPALLGRIVLMTGGAHTEHAQSELERCGRPVIMKPIDMSNLLRVLATVSSDRE